MYNKVIGLSLSFCIRDIIEENVREEDVERIFTDTKCESERDWEKLFEIYSEVYWYKNAEKAKDVVMRLRQQDKIVQTRIGKKKVGPNIARGYWVKSEEEIVFQSRM